MAGIGYGQMMTLRDITRKKTSIRKSFRSSWRHWCWPLSVACTRRSSTWWTAATSWTGRIRRGAHAASSAWPRPHVVMRWLTAASGWTDTGPSATRLSCAPRRLVPIRYSSASGCTKNCCNVDPPNRCTTLRTRTWPHRWSNITCILL